MEGVRRAHSFYLWQASAENSRHKVSLEGETSVECLAIIIHLVDVTVSGSDAFVQFVQLNFTVNNICGEIFESFCCIIAAEWCNRLGGRRGNKGNTAPRQCHRGALFICSAVLSDIAGFLALTSCIFGIWNTYFKYDWVRGNTTLFPFLFTVYHWAACITSWGISARVCLPWKWRHSFGIHNNTLYF